MNRPDVHLIEADRPELELGEVRLHPYIEQILADEQWIGDATGLVPHCLAVLKTCHTLTEWLAALAMEPLNHSKTGHEIVEVGTVICRCAPVSVGNTFLDLPQLCETADDTERYM
jgi:hypothetical protein